MMEGMFRITRLLSTDALQEGWFRGGLSVEEYEDTKLRNNGLGPTTPPLGASANLFNICAGEFHRPTHNDPLLNLC